MAPPWTDGPKRTIVLGPRLHHVVTVGAVLVGDAHQDLGTVLLDAGLGRLALEAVPDVLGDQLPRAPQRRIEVDDLVDREAHVVGEGRPVRLELAGVVGELADHDRLARPASWATTGAAPMAAVSRAKPGSSPRCGPT